ncbi:LysR family transcriptional regulator [Rouxiella sp. WC2420]|uniref:LysR family transcriptional regulator n=1 Tax=Rouxiella sp. WC2420 TaxID=3234145 RepID=A0AB39VVN4_9GAMM
MISNFSAIESFFWAAQLSSFRAAAELLNVSQPTISYRIKELEASLGISLFDRQGRGVELTSDGHALCAYVERMMSIASDIEANVSVRRHQTQPIRLGIIDSFAIICLPTLLKRIDKLHPNLRVSITTDNSHALAAKLSNGSIDLAILSTPPQLPGVELTSLGKQSISWVASPALGLGQQRLSAERFSQLRIFSTPAPSNLHYLILGSLGKDPALNLHVNECSSLALILTLVKEGLGISLLPERIAQQELAGGLLEMLSSDSFSLPPQDVFIAHNKGIINRSVKLMAALIHDVALESDYVYQA